MSHPDAAKSLILMSMLLPVTPILEFSDTLLLKEDFAELSKIRNDLGLHSKVKTNIINNGTVFVYKRLVLD